MRASTTVHDATENYGTDSLVAILNAFECSCNTFCAASNPSQRAQRAMHFNRNAGLPTDVRKKAERVIFADSFHTRDQRSSYGPGQLTRLW